VDSPESGALGYMERIALVDCKDRMLYRIFSRNLGLGVFNQSNNGFIGIRNKFGRNYLFTEYHYDCGPPFGTVSPDEELEMAPLGMSLESFLVNIDSLTRREVAFDGAILDGFRGLYFLDSGEASVEIQPEYIYNTQLFEWLKTKEAHYRPDFFDAVFS